jgi:hypothetical protein
VSQIAGLEDGWQKAASEAGKLSVASGNRMAALGGNVDMSISIRLMSVLNISSETFLGGTDSIPKASLSSAG